MSLHTNAGVDQRALKLAVKLADRRDRNSDWLRQKERDAELSRDTHADNQMPEVITAEQRSQQIVGYKPDGEPIIKAGAGRYTMEPNTPGRVRALAQAPYAKPKQFVHHTTDTVLVDGGIVPQGTLEREHEDVHLAQMATGDRCVRCMDLLPQDKHVHLDGLRRLRESPAAYEVPTGLSPFSVCCFCGTRLQGIAPGGR